MTNLPARNFPVTDPFAELAKRLNPPEMDGEILKFRRGHWSAGKDGKKGMDGARLIARVDLLMCGWTCWKDKKPVDRRVGLIANGFVSPPRSSLGNTDEELWPRDNKGQPQDPWQHAYHLQFHEPADATIKYIWSTSSKGGTKEIGSISEAYAYHRKNSPTAVPIVELEADDYPHDSYGRVDIPVLDIVGWHGEEVPAAQAQLAPPKNDLDDDIPF